MEASTTAIYTANKIFTGNHWLNDAAIIIENGNITNILPFAEVTTKSAGHADMIAPAFLDIQIYGAEEKLLAEFTNADALHSLYQYCLAGGASHFQPTVATNSTEIFFKAIDAVNDYRLAGGKGCLGLHVEGPWINPKKRGAHIASFIHAPSISEVKTLLDYGKGVISMITLAPEICSKATIELIRSYGVIISAGHSDASYDEATTSFDEGIETVTHLYNAMSPLQHRAPGMVGAVLNHPTVMASIVPDGFHVDFSAVTIAAKLMGHRLFAITDAVTTTTTGPYPHQLVGDKYESNGILSGSALTMAKCLQNLVNHCSLSIEEALRMVSLYPAKAIKMDDRFGKIAPGMPANLVLLSNDLSVKAVVVN